MTTLVRSIIINASADAVDKVTLDGNRLSEWYEGILEAIPDDTYPNAGGVVNTTYKAVGISFKLKMISQAHVPGHYLILKMDGMITGTNKWEYTPVGDSTQLTCTFDYEIPGGGLGQALNKLVLERMNAENLEKSLSNLKAVVESS